MDEVPVANSKDIYKTINASSDTFFELVLKKPRIKSKILHKAADIVRRDVEKIARILTLEQERHLFFRSTRLPLSMRSGKAY